MKEFLDLKNLEILIENAILRILKSLFQYENKRKDKSRLKIKHIKKVKKGKGRVSLKNTIYVEIFKSNSKI